MSNENGGDKGKEQNNDRKNNDVMFKVYDMNQRGGAPRTHDIIVKTYPAEMNRDPEIKSYDLYSDENKPCLMPTEHAMKFLTDPAFRVVTPQGRRIQPVSKYDPSAPIKELAKDEVIVKYGELSREALLRRVKVLPGSDRIANNATVAEMAAFMVEHRERMAGATEKERELIGMMAQSGMDGAMSKAELDQMFGVAA